MKALSIRQPWAWAILHAGKPVENRTWWSKFRGPFFIHASQKFDVDGYDWIQTHLHRLRIKDGIPEITDQWAFPRGGIVGISNIVDCVKQHSSPWFFGPFGLVLRSTMIIEPVIPLRGQLGFFNVDEYITEWAMGLVKDLS